MAEKKKRKVPNLNSSSMADVSFLLLTFFLMTSSMDTDSGLARQLPPPPQSEEQLKMDIQRRNLMVVLVNYQNQIMVRTQAGDEWYNSIAEMEGRGGKVPLKEKVKEFVLNPNNRPDLPELIEKDFGPPIGKVLVTADSHVISLQNDATTSYKAYIAVQNELVKAYNELREEAARKYFGKSYKELLPEQQEQIKNMYPQRISEAEPKDYKLGGEK